jgi:hypothetical protein
MMRPRSAAINVAKIFARLHYDTSRIAAIAPAIRAEALPASGDEGMIAAVGEGYAFAAPASPARQLA